MKVNDIVNDLVDDSEGKGTIIDIYVNHFGTIPRAVFIVDFGDDRVFDRYEHEIMLSYHATLKVADDEAILIQGWLDTDKPIPDTGPCETVYRYTATFDFNIEADIKVCNSDTGPYIDAVLFEDGCEIGFLEVGGVLLGEYIFEDNDKMYVVTVEKIT